MKGDTEGIDGFFSRKLTDLERAHAEGEALTWWQDGTDVCCHCTGAANDIFQASGRIAILVVNDSTGLNLVNLGLAVHSRIVHVCFPCRACCVAPLLKSNETSRYLRI